MQSKKSSPSDSTLNDKQQSEISPLLEFFTNKSLNYKYKEIFAYVIMTNHIHLMVRTKEGFRLSDTVRDFKKFTAKNILEQLINPTESRGDWILKRFEFAAKSHQRNSGFQVWTHENHAIELHSNDFITQKLGYIHNNPVREGIVELPEEYLYSSAKNYAGFKGKIEIDFV